MMAMTTSNSIRVKPKVWRVVLDRKAGSPFLSAECRAAGHEADYSPFSGKCKSNRRSDKESLLRVDRQQDVRRMLSGKMHGVCRDAGLRVGAEWPTGVRIRFETRGVRRRNGHPDTMAFVEDQRRAPKIDLQL